MFHCKNRDNVNYWFKKQQQINDKKEYGTQKLSSIYSISIYVYDIIFYGRSKKTTW